MPLIRIPENVPLEPSSMARDRSVHRGAVVAGDVQRRFDDHPKLPCGVRDRKHGQDLAVALNSETDSLGRHAQPILQKRHVDVPGPLEMVGVHTDYGLTPQPLLQLTKMPECAIVNHHTRAVSVFESSLERIQPVASDVRAIELAMILSAGPANFEARVREGHEVDEWTKAVNPQYGAAPLPEPRIDVFTPYELNVRMPPTATRTAHPEQLQHEFDVVGQRTLPDRGRRDTNISIAQGAGDDCAPLRVPEGANPRPSIRQHSAH